MDVRLRLLGGIGVLALASWMSCSSSTTSTTATGDDSDSCSLNDDTEATDTVNDNGCALVERDTTSCQADREEQGLTGYWLKFSCRVTLTKSGSNVVIDFDSQPDHLSYYFGSSNACYETYDIDGRAANPNSIEAQDISMTVPLTGTAGTPVDMSEGVVGVSINGVSIYDNTAAPGDDIYDEDDTFDKCDGHPDVNSRYHYHSEPPSISQEDDAFVGVMRDGFPIYGRLDPDGSTPTLDAAGGHTGETVDSDDPVYHYHVNEQTNGTDTIYFITDGSYKGTAGDCTGCN